MTDKEFRKLSRAELIEIIYELQKREEEDNKTIEELNQKLEERELCLAEAGSIAEAALKLNQVFEAAQAAADQYLLSVHAVSEKKKQSETAVQDKKEDLLTKYFKIGSKNGKSK